MQLVSTMPEDIEKDIHSKVYSSRPDKEKSESHQAQTLCRSFLPLLIYLYARPTPAVLQKDEKT